MTSAVREIETNDVDEGTAHGLTQESSSAGVLHPYLVRQLALMRRLDPLVRADVPDAVHQMRVACRRLRSVFGTYRRLFDSTRTDPIRRDLKWLVNELGCPRDVEVLSLRIRTVLESDDEPHPDARRRPWVEARLTADHDVAHRRATQAMLAPRYVALLDTLQSTVDDPPWAARASETAWHELPGAIRQDWHRLRKAAKAADRATTLPDRAARLHEVRKAAKRVRYSAEAIEPAFGRDAARFALAVANLQTVLGDHHDDVVTSQKLRDLAGSAGHDSDAFAFADLATRLDESNRRRETSYRKALSEASDSNRLRWLERRRGTERASWPRPMAEQQGTGHQAVSSVDIESLLTGQRSEVIDEAFATLERSHEVHYEQSGEEFTRQALSELFDLVVVALRDRHLGPVSTYCEDVAERRFAAGFGITEVQTAFNAVEVAMWQRLVAGVPSQDLAEAVGLLSTVLGFGKDALARRYVALASQRHVPTLDLSALFAGTEG